MSVRRREHPKGMSGIYMSYHERQTREHQRRDYAYGTKNVATLPLCVYSSVALLCRAR
jgi:hypothetical protein